MSGRTCKTFWGTSENLWRTPSLLPTHSLAKKRGSGPSRTSFDKISKRNQLPPSHHTLVVQVSPPMLVIALDNPVALVELSEAGYSCLVGICPPEKLPE